jgi:hypothetical protein
MKACFLSGYQLSTGGAELASTPKDTGDTEAAIAMLRYVEGKLREADAAWQQEEAALLDAAKGGKPDTTGPGS